MPEVAVSDGAIALALSAFALWAPLAWRLLLLRREPHDSPQRVIGELRLAQMAAMVLVFVAAAHAGLAVARLEVPGAGLEIALSMGFLVFASAAVLRDPPEALSWLALGFLGHAVLDVLHRPGLLPELLVPGWYARDCATLSALVAAVCYLAVRRRRF
ncbi:MAG: hypothetical protein MUF60_05950 [Vicinamibacterales bacterium]|nr:hypothetical protein [Vicinamibacterales bacterium]